MVERGRVELAECGDERYWSSFKVDIFDAVPARCGVLCFLEVFVDFFGGDCFHVFFVTVVLIVDDLFDWVVGHIRKVW